jgi:hypothetical protein
MVKTQSYMRAHSLLSRYFTAKCETCTRVLQHTGIGDVCTPTSSFHLYCEGYSQEPKETPYPILPPRRGRNRAILARPKAASLCSSAKTNGSSHPANRERCFSQNLSQLSAIMIISRLTIFSSSEVTFPRRLTFSWKRSLFAF